MTDERTITPQQAAELFGIERRRVSDWLYQRRLKPAGYLTGRGRTGRTPLVRYRDVVELVAQDAGRDAPGQTG